MDVDIVGIRSVDQVSWWQPLAEMLHLFIRKTYMSSSDVYTLRIGEAEAVSLELVVSTGCHRKSVSTSVLRMPLRGESKPMTLWRPESNDCTGTGPAGTGTKLSSGAWIAGADIDGDLGGTGCEC